MRLEDLETNLSPAIAAYIEDVYPGLQGSQLPSVICLDDIQFKAALRVRDRKTMAEAAYNIPSNALYFRNRPTEKSVAHESEHWAQAQRVGPDKYIEQLQSEKFFLEYERLANDAASANAFKLTGKY